MSRSRLGLEAERLGSRLGLGHEGLVSIPGFGAEPQPKLILVQLALKSDIWWQRF